MNDRALQEVPFNEMHNRSHFSRNDPGEENGFFDDEAVKNHLQSYNGNSGAQTRRQNHQGPQI